MDEIKSYHNPPTEREILIKKATSEFFDNYKGDGNLNEDWLDKVYECVNKRLVEAGENPLKKLW